MAPDRPTETPPPPGPPAVPSRETSHNATDATFRPNTATPNATDSDLFGSDEFWDVPPAARQTGFRADPRPASGDMTVPPRDLADLWGDDWDDAIGPGHTLKGPDAVRARGTTLRNLSKASTDPQAAPHADGYDLLTTLGEGGVGIVYQAHQQSIDRRIALKMIKPDLARDADECGKFVSEALVTGALDHPNIVPIHDLGRTTDGQPFYVMRLVRGTPWNEALPELSLAENLRILLAVCDAVSFAHSKGVIHRDLKPANVMLGEFGEVQVMDWGLGAAVTADGKAPQLTQSAAAGGTPAYMAPEMVTGDDGPVGVHSDVYLLGAILYEILTGQPPHGGERVLECLDNARENRIQPTDVQNVLLDIALEAMATAPADRYASVRAFKQAILDYQTNAESIRLCDQAADELAKAEHSGEYEDYAQALFGYRQALQLWPGNEAARTAQHIAQFLYGRRAFERGDYDLAASVLNPERATHADLLKQIHAAQRARASARRRLRRFRLAAYALTAAVITILTVAAISIAAARRHEEHAKNAALAAKEEAVHARDLAERARAAEAEQRSAADAARLRAEAEEKRALQALADLKAATTALVAAQSEEERARAQANAAELVTSRTRDELAKTGMLLDNSWWAFDAAAAHARQLAAAVTLGVPAERTIALAPNVALDLVLIPPGEFVMGSPPKETLRAADEYLHRVALTAPFYMARYELTRSQWEALTGTPPPPGEAVTNDPRAPVTGISYERIVREVLPALQRFAPAGWHFALPTEAQWEYACRAGTPTAYADGDGEAALTDIGWYLGNSSHHLHPVGAKPANAFGLYDMHGNAGEICVDEHDPAFYLDSPTDDPVHNGPGERPVVRGGSILNTAQHCRSAYRSYVYAKNRYDFLGIRLVLVQDR